ncbi:MAG TPA: lysylphosphatidylglycerol synthase transmembrane domain-containing protein [bacterium]
MIKRLLLIVVGVALFIFILSKVDLPTLFAQLKETNPLLCLATVATFLVMVYLKGVRWSYLLKMQGYRYSIWNCFLIYMASLYWGNITPGRAGDFMKVLYLKEDLKLPMGTGITSVLVDRVFDLYLLLILGCLGILIYPMPADPHLIQLVWIFFGLLVFVTILAFNRRIGEFLIKAVFQKVLGSQMKEKANQTFEDFHKGMEAFYSPALFIPILLSLASYLIFFWGCSLLARAIGLDISIFYLAFVISVVNIVSLLTFLGMGTREGALIILFGLISLTREQAMAYSLLLFFTGTLLFTLLCFFCFLLKPVRLKSQS